MVRGQGALQEVFGFGAPRLSTLQSFRVAEVRWACTDTRHYHRQSRYQLGYHKQQRSTWLFLYVLRTVKGHVAARNVDTSFWNDVLDVLVTIPATTLWPKVEPCSSVCPRSIGVSTDLGCPCLGMVWMRIFLQ